MKRYTYAWLKPSDIHVNHQLARSKHEPATGNWFIESNYFVAWERATNASLWIHGIPGAGKTILCSTIIERIINSCASNPPDQCAHFYFEFNEKRTVDTMLRSIIVQLCKRKKKMPSELHQIYEQYENGLRPPELTNLMEIFSMLLTNTHRTYLILDALDECPMGSDKEDLLKVIRKMVGIPKHLNILITSRMEKDINEEYKSFCEKMP
jgi:ankyrin repeat domain-containing protein 50